MSDLRYPVGRFSPPASVTPELRLGFIDAIAAAPDHLRAAIRGLDEDKLDAPYRPDGWTVRQVVHHVPDSHLNAYVRLKLALTEPRPTIRPYDEAQWARLPDSTAVPVDVSIALLEALHRRWVALLRAMTPDDFAREYIHPESGRHTVDHLVALYAWHGRHHVAHITALRERMGW
ncbi:MAG TPA: putative metal-dependent hydrolase [Gemmatimonadaceae bacterium]